jgi:hypothetical protein
MSWENGVVSSPSNPLIDYPIDFVFLVMAPVVQIEPHGVQTLLWFDRARGDFLG